MENITTEVRQGQLLKALDHQEVDKWFLMHSPLLTTIILIAYLYFVLKVGPQFMKSREPFQLKSVMFAYNLYQVVFNLWLFLGFVQLDIGFTALTNCRFGTSNPRVAFTFAWWYLLSKYVDLLDTVFFVLRKKQSQVTFLHLYHHTFVVGFTWYHIKYLHDENGGQGIVVSLLNSLVHVLMYFYYFVAALGPQYQKYLWWKKYMTKIQLTQFALIMLYIGFVIVLGCNVPRGIIYFYVFNDILFIYLFLDFYWKAYKKKHNNNNNNNNNVLNGKSKVSTKAH